VKQGKRSEGVSLSDHPDPASDSQRRSGAELWKEAVRVSAKRSKNVHIIEDGGHMIRMESATEVNQLITDFCKD
jgi:pimeloyl-ACP methyl ester carboxylesterase